MRSTPVQTEPSRKVNEILKRVDALVKSENLDLAKEEILQARELDPRNMYAHAYFERIELLIAQRNRNTEAAKAKQLADEAARIKQEQERLRAERAAKEIQAREEKIRNQKPQVSHLEEISSYNRALFDAWKSGAPSIRSEEYLMTLRKANHISKDEHGKLELAVRRECYVQHFQQLWQADSPVQDGPATLKALRKQYRIGREEFDSIEFELLQQLKRPSSGPVCLIIDDDEGLLTAMTALLEDSGFEARAYTTSDEAYQYLLHSTPDIILADVNLETSTLGGFAFYEKVQQLPRLSHVPFIFISGLSDEVVIRAGKELGVDDYITKPFNGEEVVSIMKGKIRRYKELRGISAN